MRGSRAWVPPRDMSCGSRSFFSHCRHTSALFFKFDIDIYISLHPYSSLWVGIYQPNKYIQAPHPLFIGAIESISSQNTEIEMPDTCA